jgi:hypothetical protein
VYLSPHQRTGFHAYWCSGLNTRPPSHSDIARCRARKPVPDHSVTHETRMCCDQVVHVGPAWLLLQGSLRVAITTPSEPHCPARVRPSRCRVIQSQPTAPDHAGPGIAFDTTFSIVDKDPTRTAEGHSVRHTPCPVPHTPPQVDAHRKSPARHLPHTHRWPRHPWPEPLRCVTGLRLVHPP